MALGFPFNSGILAYISPNVLVTDNLPGITLCGPRTNECSYPSYNIFIAGLAY